jgi:hypothetical protein
MQPLHQPDDLICGIAVSLRSADELQISAMMLSAK